MRKFGRTPCARCGREFGEQPSWSDTWGKVPICGPCHHYIFNEGGKRAIREFIEEHHMEI